MMQLRQLTSLITISWPLDYHINKACEIEWGVPAYYETQSVFPGHFVQAFVIWISSEALKAVILVHWCSHPPPPRINSKEVLARWCSGCFSDTVSRESSGALCLQQLFPHKQKAERFVLPGTNLPHWVLRIKEGRWGNKRVCLQEERESVEVHFCVKERGRMELVILFLSHFLPKNTLPWNKWAVIRCHCVSQHEIIEECNYHFAQQTFSLNNWEH